MSYLYLCMNLPILVCIDILDAHTKENEVLNENIGFVRHIHIFSFSSDQLIMIFE